MAITTFDKFAGVGRTLSLLDEELILLGNDEVGTKSGRYISIQKPRDGLLAMKYTSQSIPLSGSPYRHTSLVSKNTLAIVGGKFKSKGILSKFTWTGLFLEWQNGTKFKADFAGSCAIKLGTDLHIIFGGERKISSRQISERGVVKLNITQKVAVEMKPMKRGRKFHSCQLLDKSVVLLSGGLDQSVIQQDELYDVTSEEKDVLLSLDQSLRRSHHAVVRLGDRIYAMGGLDSEGKAPSKIAEFAMTSHSWIESTQELHSSNTSEVVTTEFPTASLDCVSECQCGNASLKERIYGGDDAKVNIIITK